MVSTNATTSAYTVPISAEISFPPKKGEYQLPSLVTGPENLILSVLAPQQFSISTETLVALLGIVMTALVGWFLPYIASWYKSRKQGKYVKQLMTRVINTSTEESSATLVRLKDEIAQRYGYGDISDSQYKILNDKITELLNKDKDSE